MDPQSLINAGFSLAGLLGGWMLNRIWTAVDHLQNQDQDLAGKVQAIEVLVAGKYVHRDDFKELSSALFHKLDRIEAKVDGKMDK